MKTYRGDMQVIASPLKGACGSYKSSNLPTACMFRAGARLSVHRKDSRRQSSRKALSIRAEGAIKDGELVSNLRKSLYFAQHGDL